MNSKNLCYFAILGVEVDYFSFPIAYSVLFNCRHMLKGVKYKIALHTLHIVVKLIHKFHTI